MLFNLDLQATFIQEIIESLHQQGKKLKPI